MSYHVSENPLPKLMYYLVKVTSYKHDQLFKSFRVLWCSYGLASLYTDYYGDKTIIALLFPYFQRNQAGSSPAMEFMGFKQCMDYLLGCGVLITTFISDRHTTIASHMKKVLTKIVHYFDIWHLKKSKLLIKDYFGNA